MDGGWRSDVVPRGPRQLRWVHRGAWIPGALAATLLVACPESGDDGDKQDAGAHDDDAGEFVDSGIPGQPAVLEVNFSPAMAELTSIDGSRPTQHFDVTARLADGTTITATSAVFTVSPTLLGTFTATTGIFTANGRVGGEGRITATLRGKSGHATLRVRLQQTIFVGGTPIDAADLFDATGVVDVSREAGILYPLDRAVMPQNVAPPNVQWTNSEAGDVFRIKLSKPNVDVLVYYASAAAVDFTNSWVVDLDAWRRVAQSEPNEWAEVVVDRYEAATRETIVGTPVRVRFPQAALQGSIYYWDIGAGRIVRINDGTSERDEGFMPNPPLGCVGCHAVSPNGRYMAGRLGGGDNVATVFDLTQDLSGNPPPSLYPVDGNTIRWWFSTWNPANNRLIVSVNEGGGGSELRLVDPFLGQFLTPNMGTLPSGGVTHPAWSPDGRWLAYVGNMSSWGGDNYNGDIFKLPVTGTVAFGAPELVVTGTSAPGLPGGSAASYPSWTPDSQRIAFAHGSSSRSESGQSALYMIGGNRAGLVRLDKACGGADTSNNFQPRFSPFAQDGYFWMSFLSRRDYGNDRAGTRYSGRQQVWVSAIKINPAPGEDPSEVPYWLPGQNTQSMNIAAFWSPRACRELTEGCSVDAECCSGECSDSGNVCIARTSCGEVGARCTDNNQCCGGVLCIDGTCGVL